MRVVLIGDIHASRKWATPWHLAGKRLLGMANLWLNRRRRFDLALLDNALSHAASLNPDLVLASGDISTTALAGEFMDVAHLWQRHLATVPTLMVPGNHDRYTFSATRRKIMERYFAESLPEKFPELRRIAERWYLLRLDTAVPRMVTSRGRLGSRQLAETHELLQSISPSASLIVLCHYPLQVPPACPDRWNHRLVDVRPLRACLAGYHHRAIFLHGHLHRPWCLQPHDPSLSHVMMINAGSPTHRDRPCPHGHGFWHLDLSSSPGTPVEIVHHEPRLISASTASASAATTWQSVTTHLDHDAVMSEIDPD